MLSIVAIAAMTLSLPVAAEHRALDTSVGQAVDVSFEMTNARLMREGYYSIRMVDGDPLRLWAVNSEDREVILRINSRSGEVDSAIYANAMDK